VASQRGSYACCGRRRRGRKGDALASRLPWTTAGSSLAHLAFALLFVLPDARLPPRSPGNGLQIDVQSSELGDDGSEGEAPIASSRALSAGSWRPRSSHARLGADLVPNGSPSAPQAGGKPWERSSRSLGREGLEQKSGRVGSPEDTSDLTASASLGSTRAWSPESLFGSSHDGANAVDALLFGTPRPGAGSQAHPPRLGGIQYWEECPWPAAGNRAGIDRATARVAVDVTADGHPTRAYLVEDESPGYGFGVDALTCAMDHRYIPGSDDAGRAVAGTTPPFAVRFRRRQR